MLAGACYALLAALVYLPVAPFATRDLPVCNCGDNAMAAAFLEWTPWALVHGHNPLLTTYQYFPAGADLAANTTMPVLGILLAPLTLTVGPVLTLNVVLRLALLTAALSAYALVRRLGAPAPAAFAAGLLFGFSPYLLGQGQTHANLAFVALFPLLLLLALEVLVRQARPAAGAGALLGLLAALQYGISSELLADAAVVGVVVLAIAAAVHRRAARARAGHALRAAGWALALFVPLTAYPIGLALFGPNHPNGPPRDPSQLHALSADLLGAAVPTGRQAITAGLAGPGSGWVSGNLVENGVYVGLPLLALAVWLLVRHRRDRRVAWAGVGAAVAYVLALGPQLRVAGIATGIPLPAALLTHLPLLDAIVPVRFFVFGWLALAVLLATGLAAESRRASAAGPAAERCASDGCHSPESSAVSRSVRRATAGAPRVAGLRKPVLLAAVTAIALLPLLPRLPFPRTPTGTGPDESYAIPAFFEPGGGESAIPAGSPTLVYPFSDPAQTAGTVDEAVLWQAVGQERFAILDGDATRPGAHGTGTEAAPPLVPPELETMLLDAYFGPDAYYEKSALHTGVFPALTAGVRAGVRAALALYRISTVVVDPVGADPGELVAALQTILGRPPVRSGGVLVWYGVPADLRGD